MDRWATSALIRCTNEREAVERGRQQRPREEGVVSWRRWKRTARHGKCRPQGVLPVAAGDLWSSLDEDLPFMDRVFLTRAGPVACAHSVHLPRRAHARTFGPTCLVNRCYATIALCTSCAHGTRVFTLQRIGRNPASRRAAPSDPLAGNGQPAGNDRPAGNDSPAGCGRGGCRSGWARLGRRSVRRPLDGETGAKSKGAASDGSGHPRPEIAPQIRVSRPARHRNAPCLP